MRGIPQKRRRTSVLSIQQYGIQFKRQISLYKTFYTDVVLFINPIYHYLLRLLKTTRWCDVTFSMEIGNLAIWMDPQTVLPCPLSGCMHSLCLMCARGWEACSLLGEDAPVILHARRAPPKDACRKRPTPSDGAAVYLIYKKI